MAKIYIQKLKGTLFQKKVWSDGSLGGYSGRGGIKTKQALLRTEGVDL